MDNVPNQYLRNAVMTASPEQLHLMLYDGAIRFCRMGIDGIREKKWEQAFNGFSRAQKIMLEMNNSLRPEVDEELCKRMSALYTFIYRTLVEASIQRSIEKADEALKLIEYQRETWVMLMEKRAQESADAATQADASFDRYTDDSLVAQGSYGTISLEG